MIRTKRKINKQRGSRSNGGGCTKKRRGAGNKGGKGKAGMGKQHWTWTVIHDPNHFGKHGFKRPQKTIHKSYPVNLNFLNDKAEEFVEQGIATKEDDVIVIDVTELGYNKVLATGSLDIPLVVKSPAFSESAIEKIEEAGGEAVEL
jgi:large subunit ribosomal protein L15